MDERIDQARPDVAVAAIATRQHGVVSWQQLVAAGLGRGAIAHRVRAGLLHRLHRGVFAVGHVALTRESRWMAAVLAYGSRAALSHASALAHWDLRASSAAIIDIAVRSRNGLARRQGIRLHRLGALTATEVATHRGIPTTSVARTLLDAASRLQRPGLARAVERAEVLRLFDLGAVLGTLSAHPTHPGARRLRNALAVYRDDELTRSELEARFLTLCADHHIPRPLVNRVVDGEEVDFYWPEQRLIVETDGRRTHLTPAAFERDRASDARRALAGDRVVRFTHRQVCDEAARVAGTLLGLLGRPDGARR